MTEMSIVEGYNQGIRDELFKNNIIFMYDEYIKATREISFDFKYEEHLDKMFNNLKRIFMDLWV